MQNLGVDMFALSNQNAQNADSADEVFSAFENSLQGIEMIFNDTAKRSGRCCGREPWWRGGCGRYRSWRSGGSRWWRRRWRCPQVAAAT
eukprot:COSAG01_NODE_5605_length_4149_cov_63.426808_1_plen_89_part_00